MSSGPSLASIQVGLPRAYGSDDAVSPFDKPWTTGIFKHAVEGAAAVRRTFVEGDGQGDTINHGGADKAICAYSADHYEHWRRALGVDPFVHGAFGENFTVRRLVEDDVCIGDTWNIGAVTVQVSQPRQPCWKLARKWRIKELADTVIASGRTGWYFRVIKEGAVHAGDECTLVARPNPEWTITAANRVMYARPYDRDGCAALAAVSLLSDAWRRTLSGRAAAPLGS